LGELSLLVGELGLGESNLQCGPENWKTCRVI